MESLRMMIIGGILVFLPLIAVSSSVVCPDGVESCESDNTCCKLRGSEHYFCCPLPNAVCCSDSLHCCPQGYQCDNETNACKEVAKTSLTTKETAKDIVICPGDDVICNDGATCCETSQNDWACCPLPNAVCCKDGAHCCPSNTYCDLKNDVCVFKRNATNTQRIKAKLLSKAHKVTQDDEVSNKTCPGDTSCAEDSSCCPMSGGKWGCCPFPYAICCGDLTTCCDAVLADCLPGGYCTFKKSIVNMHNKPPVKEVLCPDNQSKCPSGYSCCQTPNGKWGCCPLSEAICCPDHIHCCPKGSVCDVAYSRCRQGLSSFPWLEKVPAL